MLVTKVLPGLIISLGLAVIAVCVWLLLLPTPADQGRVRAATGAQALLSTNPPTLPMLQPPTLATIAFPQSSTALPAEPQPVSLEQPKPDTSAAPSSTPTPRPIVNLGHADLARVWSYTGAAGGNVIPVKNLALVPAGIVVDASNGRVLWAKNSRTAREIASMTKVMTALVALEAVQNGRASLHDKVVTSRAAALVGGSQVYLKQGETFTLAELLKALLIVSANDAAHAIAEHIAGSDRAFVQRMNARAKELGMTATRYYNPHGLPLASGHNVSSPLDMALLAREALKHTLLMQWAGTWTDTFRNGSFALANHNKLLRRVRGVDGLKTGYYSRAGFSSTVTVMRDGHRLIVVVIGTKLKTTRDECLKDLIEWGYRQPPVKP